MYFQKVIGKKTLGKKLTFCIASCPPPTKRSRIRIQKSAVRIPGSGSVPKCHGSTTLLDHVLEEYGGLEWEMGEKRSPEFL
jgi:hypothetical protein